MYVCSRTLVIKRVNSISGLIQLTLEGSKPQMTTRNEPEVITGNKPEVTRILNRKWTGSD